MKKIAVIGAGPAGIYASDILYETAQNIQVDLFERLPSPYGLVRYGVAPDHPRIKLIIDALEATLNKGKINLFLNVDFGRDISLDDLKQYYDAVIFATGAIKDRSLGIPGEKLNGSFGAADFVNWYDAHPSAPELWPLENKNVCVIGSGNVALDISRILAKDPNALLKTEIPKNVANCLLNSAVENVHILIRKGPGDIKFSPLEFRELSEAEGIQIILDKNDFDWDADASEIASNNQKKVIKRIFETILATKPKKTRKIHLHFFAETKEIKGKNGSVKSIIFNKLNRRTGESITEELNVGQVYRAIGYYSSPLKDIPFDEESGVIPNNEGRVVDLSGRAIYGLYATGWIKRGPVGLIGSTKSDAKQTISHLLDDLAAGKGFNPPKNNESIESLLTGRNINFGTLKNWQNLDKKEIALGAPLGKTRLKLKTLEEQIAAWSD